MNGHVTCHGRTSREVLDRPDSTSLCGLSGVHGIHTDHDPPARHQRRIVMRYFAHPVPVTHDEACCSGLSPQCHGLTEGERRDPRVLHSVRLLRASVKNTGTREAK